jgi:hypothetical protein
MEGDNRMEGNHEHAPGHFRRTVNIAFWTLLCIWSCCGLSSQKADIAEVRSSSIAAHPRWVGNFFQDQRYHVYAVRITPKLLPDRIGEDVIVRLGTTTEELILSLGCPHEVLGGRTLGDDFSFVYFTTLDCYVFDFRRTPGNKNMLCAISAFGGY